MAHRARKEEAGNAPELTTRTARRAAPDKAHSGVLERKEQQAGFPPSYLGLQQRRAARRSSFETSAADEVGRLTMSVRPFPARANASSSHPPRVLEEADLPKSAPRALSESPLVVVPSSNRSQERD